MSTHFVVTCLPDHHLTERTNWPVESTCTEVVEAIESGIKQILTDFSYVEVQHHLTFPCTLADCVNQGHPARLLYSGSQPSACNKTGKRFNLPSNYHVWRLSLHVNSSQQATSQQSASPTLGYTPGNDYHNNLVIICWLHVPLYIIAASGSLPAYSSTGTVTDTSNISSSDPGELNKCSFYVF